MKARNVPLSSFQRRDQPTLRRARLWLGDDRCYWCRRTTRWKCPKKTPRASHSNSPLLPLRATLDHLYPRWHTLRGAPHSTVLACWECNQRRAQEWTYWLSSVKRLAGQLIAIGERERQKAA